MNAVEIEEAISALAEKTFDAAAFPYAFLDPTSNILKVSNPLDDLLASLAKAGDNPRKLLNRRSCPEGLSRRARARPPLRSNAPRRHDAGEAERFGGSVGRAGQATKRRSVVSSEARVTFFKVSTSLGVAVRMTSAPT